MTQQQESAESKANTDSLLLDVVQAVLGRNDGGHAYTVRQERFWCSATPRWFAPRTQGWKLHVSATPLSAPIILGRVSELLVRRGCAFKFAGNLQRVVEQVSVNYSRGGGGKFITVYPEDDEQFRQVASELDFAVNGLPGPRILSDRQLRPGSLIHYRYGVFSAEDQLTNDGAFESMLTAPDGLHLSDQRLPWFSPPTWAPSPFLDEQMVVPTAPEAVTLHGRFAAQRALKQANKGGVYLAVDEHVGTQVVIKQARAHVCARFDGTDIRDTLRHEAAMLDEFAPLGIAPAKVALFEQQNDLFLVEEYVPGVKLRRWVTESLIKPGGQSWRQAVSMIGDLVELLATAHRTGLVLRDFNPNNVMVLPNDEVRLIDLEHAVKPGVEVTSVETAGYAAPEATESAHGPAPEQSADLFSLGATIFYVITGVDPSLVADHPRERSIQSRLDHLASAMEAAHPALSRFVPLIRGLMTDNPQNRWEVPQVRAFLTKLPKSLPATASARSRKRTGAPHLSGEVQDRLLSDGLTHAVRTMTPDANWLWPASFSGMTADPCNVQHGAAGVLAVLTRAAQAYGKESLHDSVREVAAWVDERAYVIPRLLPGLYFGRSGTAWALHDAASYLGDQPMVERAIELAKQIPVKWDNPDVCHGLAGAGLAHLHLWRATGDCELYERALAYADAVYAAAEVHEGLALWPIPADFDSALAGTAQYGFAHGAAGVGAFMLAAAVASGQEKYLQAALAAGRTLEQAADVEQGAAWWPSGDKGDDSRLPHWCSGSAGVGTFLIRLWQATGEQRWLGLAQGAAHAVMQNLWHTTPSACHGLAGRGEFLLDMAQLTGEAHYRGQAEEVAAILEPRHALRDGLMVLGDESGRDVTLGYNTGLSGVLGFLLRLQDGGQRWWMADADMPKTVPVQQTTLIALPGAR
ncbi:class IV lanthionine synthetase LanL (plasmid) [Streptomyces sp. NBC_00289]|uniref:class IV lanthionine synthetase LanL n=1 Tax=Streptomyces sp. NBC_00289 TaxID=2975703 RepID=UPI002F90760D